MRGMLVKPGCSYYVCIVIRKTREKNRNFTNTTVPNSSSRICHVQLFYLSPRRQPPIAPESLNSEQDCRKNPEP